MMNRVALVLLMFASVTLGDRPIVMTIVGAPGTQEYGKAFREWAGTWETTAKKADATYVSIGLADSEEKAADLGLVAATLLGMQASEHPLWIVMIGHGTFNGKVAKFNLRGPDLSADQMAVWLDGVRRPIAVVNCSASSSPFLSKLAKKGRVVVTATKSGYEQNYARFGEYISKAIGDVGSDLDKDGQTSLLEAFLTASRSVGAFYEKDGRLVTEFALIDDNGDAVGTRADWYRGIRPTKKPAGGGEADGYRAHQFHLVRSASEQAMPIEVRKERDAIELEVIRLRDVKESMDQASYYEQLEPLLVRLAELYEQVEEAGSGVEGNSSEANPDPGE